MVSIVLNLIKEIKIKQAYIYISLNQRTKIKPFFIKYIYIQPTW